MSGPLSSCVPPFPTVLLGGTYDGEFSSAAPLFPTVPLGGTRDGGFRLLRRHAPHP